MFACMLALLAMEIGSGPGSANARRGVIDLGGATGERGVVELSGEWEFYWGRLLDPATFARSGELEPDAYFALPSPWNRFSLKGKRLPAEGAATLRLKVFHGLKGREVGVMIKKINCAFALYADSRLIARAGEVASSPAGFRPEYRPQSVYFVPESNETVLTLQIANFFSDSNSGALDAIGFGERRAVEASTDELFIEDAFCIGGRALFVVIFLATFLLTGSGLALMFALYNLFMMIRVSMLSEVLFLRLFHAAGMRGFTFLFVVASYMTILFQMLSVYAFLRSDEAPPLPGGARDGPIAYFLNGGRAGRIALAAILLHLAAVVFYGFTIGVSDPGSLYLFIPIGLFCLFYPLRLLGSHIGKYGRNQILFWFYILYTTNTLYELLSQALILHRDFVYPLAHLASFRVRHQIITYCIVASFSFYFLYHIIASHFAGVHGGARDLALDYIAGKFRVTGLELEVMKMAMRGLTYEEIADECLVSKSMVKAHLGSVYRKLEVKNKTELANKLASLSRTSS